MQIGVNIVPGVVYTCPHTFNTQQAEWRTVLYVCMDYFGQGAKPLVHSWKKMGKERADIVALRDAAREDDLAHARKGTAKVAFTKSQRPPCMTIAAHIQPSSRETPGVATQGSPGVHATRCEALRSAVCNNIIITLSAVNNNEQSTSGL